MNLKESLKEEVKVQRRWAHGRVGLLDAKLVDTPLGDILNKIPRARRVVPRVCGEVVIGAMYPAFRLTGFSRQEIEGTAARDEKEAKDLIGGH